VLAYAEQILAGETADPRVVVPAAILHDIGIRQAEAKYGSGAGTYQEIEGPPIARPILQRAGIEPEVVEHVCRIIATITALGTSTRRNSASSGTPTGW